MKVHISPTARLHLDELMAWWDENRPAARVRVEEAFERALAFITSHPMLGKTYPQAPRYRTKRLTGTPYYLAYRVDEGKGIIFVAGIWSSAGGEDPDLG